MKDEIDKKALGKRIKQLRLSLGETAEAFGKRLTPQANRSLVSAWENGRYVPSPERLKKIAEIGNISVNELLYGSFKEYVLSFIYDEDGIFMNPSEFKNTQEVAAFSRWALNEYYPKNKDNLESFPSKVKLLSEFRLFMQSSPKYHDQERLGDYLNALKKFTNKWNKEGKTKETKEVTEVQLEYIEGAIEFYNNIFNKKDN